ncbi:MAG: branched-chain amino acid ABC transporter permease, partial [Halobacteria archaeon]|nr:branched-chain amino acid ABC transporter permease [Halobacteria archaeon]
GYFSAHVKGVYLTIVSFAFADVLYLLFLADPCKGTAAFCTTNSFSGLTATSPTLHLGFTSVSLFSSSTFYTFALVVFALAYLVTKRLLRTPLGATFKGIRENDERMRALGYDVTWFKVTAFVVSGALSSLAGGLLALLNLGVDPSMLSWQNSGEILLVTILGGPGTLVGPVLGGAAISALKLLISDYLSPQLWRLTLGVVFVLLILLLPSGVYKHVTSLRRAVRRRLK